MFAPAGPPSPQNCPLPALREDVQLLPGTPTVTGAATWLIFDPLANRFFQIDIEAYELLSFWNSAKTVGQMCEAVKSHFGRDIEVEDVTSLMQFLDHSNLLVETAQGWRGYSQRVESMKHSWLMWLIHNYLFIKVPLLRPEPFLQATLPVANIFFSRAWRIFVIGVTLAGLYLTSRQWTEFLSTFQYFFTLDGFVSFAITLMVIKTLHELGHAYAATRYNCRVPTMGVAFLVMMPMLYTDVTDAWRLKSRRERMVIDGAGIIVELMLAGIATFLWAFLPDGPGRSVAFVVATTSWVTSLIINLSPLMRFDGYFLWSDFIGIPNLQGRANALGRWKLREVLFKLNEPCPDTLPARTQALVITYAWVVWLYRLIVFTGIALAVYHMFFKVLGIVLFAIEIFWFIFKPIVSELKAWADRYRSRGTTARGRFAVFLGCVAVLALIVPWSGHVAVPAIVEPAEFARLFPQAPGMVSAVYVKAGQEVAAGEALMELSSPKLRHELKQNDTNIALLQTRLARRIADEKDRSQSLSIEQELNMLQRKREGMLREIAEMRVLSPIEGRVAELPDDMKVGRWVGRSDELAIIAAPKGSVVRGYVKQDDLGRLAEGTGGRFSFDHPMRKSADVVVDKISYSGAPTVDIPELASTYTGPIAVQEDKERKLVPHEGIYLVTFKPVEADIDTMHVMRGVVLLSGKPESVLAAFWRQMLKVLVRESSA